MPQWATTTCWCHKEQPGERHGPGSKPGQGENGRNAYRAADTHEKRLRATDQNIHCPVTPCTGDIRAALHGFPYPSVTLGLALHPLKGAALSGSTAQMPNLTQLLISYAREKLAGATFTTVSLQKGGSSKEQSACALEQAARTINIDGAANKGNGRLTAEWT